MTIGKAFAYQLVGRKSAALPAVVDGASEEAQLDKRAQLQVRTTPPTSLYKTLAFGKSGVIKSTGAGALFELDVYNAATALRYLQLFDLTAVPADGVVPLLTYPCPSAVPMSLKWDGGLDFATGLCWCFSTTVGTKTIVTADDALLSSARYL